MHGLENTQNNLENTKNKGNQVNESYSVSSWLGTACWAVRLKGRGWLLHSSLHQFKAEDWLLPNLGISR